MNLDPVTADAAKKRAKDQRRSFAAYVATLIEKDLVARGVLEEAEPYGSTPPQTADLAADVLSQKAGNLLNRQAAQKNPKATHDRHK